MNVRNMLQIHAREIEDKKYKTKTCETKMERVEFIDQKRKALLDHAHYLIESGSKNRFAIANCFLKIFNLTEYANSNSSFVFRYSST